MKAVTVERYGDASGVQIREVPTPVVGASEVLIEVHAAGVNPLDNKVRAGEFKAFLPYKPPFGLGHDVAGIVVEVGAAVTRFSVGDEVYARPRRDQVGTFADLVSVHQDDVAGKPTSLSMVEAASLPLVSLTAWQALVERTGVQAGDQVLIHAGSGGVGSIAVQLAHHLGATVVSTAGTRNVQLVKDLGADLVVDYRQQDFETLVRDVDMVLDSVGGAILDKSLRVLRPGGIAVGITGPPDPAFAREVGANPVVRAAMTALSARVRWTARRLGVHYQFLFMTPSGTQLARIADLVDAGHIRPIIDRVLPFTDVLEALKLVENGPGNPGKIVVQMR